MSALMIPGIWMTLGTRRLCVPPLSLGSLELLQEQLDEMPLLKMTDRKAVGTVIDATHAALVRNYPDMTRTEVANLVDVSNMGDVYESVMDVTGLKRKALGEGNQEAVSAQPGATSSPTSAPTPAGPGATSESTSTSPPSTP